MKKQELIHLHGLLSEVQSQYDRWSMELDLEEYEELGVKPTSIHKSKTDHKAAVFALADGITGADPAESEPVAPKAD
jgi:Predicted metal-binding protein